MTTPTIIEALEHVAGLQHRTLRRGAWSSLRCPAHPDREASLRVIIEDGDRVGIRCFAHCPREAILSALGVTDRPGERHESRVWTPALPPPPPPHEHPYEARDRGASLYVVRDLRGVVRAVKARYPGKVMVWYSPWIACPRHPDTVCWVKGLVYPDLRGGFRKPVTELPLYNTEYLASDPLYAGDTSILIVEGEKTADVVRRLGHRPALGTVTGANGTPDIEVLRVLRGRHVVLCPDNDEPGRAHMSHIGSSLSGIAASISWQEPPDDAPTHWDLADTLVPKGSPGV